MAKINKTNIKQIDGKYVSDPIICEGNTIYILFKASEGSVASLLISIDGNEFSISNDSLLCTEGANTIKVLTIPGLVIKLQSENELSDIKYLQ